MNKIQAIEKTKRYCPRLSKKQRETCKLSHQGTVIKELYHYGSPHYGMEVCAECGRYIKFVPWPRDPKNFLNASSFLKCFRMKNVREGTPKAVAQNFLK